MKLRLTLRCHPIGNPDPKAFKTLPALSKKLHANGQKYVVILDPAIPADISEGEIYEPLTQGLKKAIFIKDEQGKPAKGAVWPGGTYFPDFSMEITEEYWAQQIKSLYESGIEFDGLWIDMNEPSNFVDGTSNGCPTRIGFKYKFTVTGITITAKIFTNI